MIPFGDPNAKDATAEWEDDIKRQAQQYVEDVLHDLSKVINRPFGSVKPNKEEARAEWEMYQQDPTQLQEQKMLREKVVGELRAELEMREWDAEFWTPPANPTIMPVMGAQEGMI